MNSALVDGQNGGLAFIFYQFGIFWILVFLDFTSFDEPQGALRGQNILKNGQLFRAGGFEKLLRATGRPPGSKDFEKCHVLFRSCCLSVGIEIFPSHFHFSLYLRYFTASTSSAPKFPAK